MPKGVFVVSINPDNNRDILFQTRKDVSASDSEEQLNLRDEIDRVLVVLRMLFKDDESFNYYFKTVLSLAQAGLVGEHAAPNVAMRALKELKNEITAREAGKIKNEYMKALGIKAFIYGLPVLIVGLIIRFYFNELLFANFFFLWIGCFVGVWLSFGVRKTELKFEDLNILEKDRLDPSVRLFFTGFLTTFIGLLFSTGAVSIEFGKISTDLFSSNLQVAILIGLICGFSEKALPSKISKQAAAIIEN